MGGGGGYFSGRDSDIGRHVRQVQAGTDQEDAQYDLETNEFLRSLLSEFSDRDVDKIRARLDTIHEVLEDGEESVVDLRFGGSVSKHTYVDGLSDIDALVLLDDEALIKAGPEAAKDRLYRQLSDQLPHIPMRKGDLAITLQFDDAEIQLLPAVRAGDRVRISQPDGDGWSLVDPKGWSDPRILMQVDTRNGSELLWSWTMTR